MKNQICEAMERYGANNLTNKQLLTVLLNGNKKLPALFVEDYLSDNTDQLDILEIAGLTFEELKSRGNLTDEQVQACTQTTSTRTMRITKAKPKAASSRKK